MQFASIFWGAFMRKVSTCGAAIMREVSTCDPAVMRKDSTCDAVQTLGAVMRKDSTCDVVQVPCKCARLARFSGACKFGPAPHFPAGPANRGARDFFLDLLFFQQVFVELPVTSFMRAVVTCRRSRRFFY